MSDSSGGGASSATNLGPEALSTVLLLASDAEAEGYAEFLSAVGVRGATWLEAVEWTSLLAPNTREILAIAFERAAAVVAVVPAVGRTAPDVLVRAAMARGMWPRRTLILTADQAHAAVLAPVLTMSDDLAARRALVAELEGAGVRLSGQGDWAHAGCLQPAPTPARANDQITDVGRQVNLELHYRRRTNFLARNCVELTNHESAELSDVALTPLGKDALGIRFLGSPIASLPPETPVPFYLEPDTARLKSLRIRITGSAPTGSFMVERSIVR